MSNSCLPEEYEYHIFSIITSSKETLLHQLQSRYITYQSRVRNMKYELKVPSLHMHIMFYIFIKSFNNTWKYSSQISNGLPLTLFIRKICS